MSVNGSNAYGDVSPPPYHQHAHESPFGQPSAPPAHYVNSDVTIDVDPEDDLRYPDCHRADHYSPPSTNPHSNIASQSSAFAAPAPQLDAAPKAPPITKTVSQARWDVVRAKREAVEQLGPVGRAALQVGVTAGIFAATGLIIAAMYVPLSPAIIGVGVSVAVGCVLAGGLARAVARRENLEPLRAGDKSMRARLLAQASALSRLDNPKAAEKALLKETKDALKAIDGSYIQATEEGARASVGPLCIAGAAIFIAAIVALWVNAHKSKDGKSSASVPRSPQGNTTINNNYYNNYYGDSGGGFWRTWALMHWCYAPQPLYMPQPPTVIEHHHYYDRREQPAQRFPMNAREEERGRQYEGFAAHAPWREADGDDDVMRVEPFVFG